MGRNTDFDKKNKYHLIASISPNIPFYIPKDRKWSWLSIVSNKI
jgi:hypothetical protein